MLPLVSVVIPTRNRRKYIPQAIACYQAQSYQNRELIVVDNSDTPVEDLMPPGANYKYIGPEKISTGAIRNLACSMAKGQYICHWDDDDYSHPKRIAEQIKLLMGMCVSVVGYNEMYFIDEDDREAWLYRNPELYALGTSLLYSRDYWRAGKFPDKDVAEDSSFIERAQWKRGMACRVAGDRLIARVHSENTCDKKSFMFGPMWTSVPFSFVRGMMP